MPMGRVLTRRAWLSGMAVVPLANASPGKPMRGIFIIMATRFTDSGAVDYEDLEREVDFLVRCGVHGMVWPQLASEYASLSQDERMRGMELLAKASRGKAPALVLGVQGGNVEAALEYLRKTEDLGPDALIAIPPSQARSADDFPRYYAALSGSTKRPLFI